MRRFFLFRPITLYVPYLIHPLSNTKFCAVVHLGLFRRVEVESSAFGVASLRPLIPPRAICVENSGNSVAPTFGIWSNFITMWSRRIRRCLRWMWHHQSIIWRICWNNRWHEEILLITIIW